MGSQIAKCNGGNVLFDLRVQNLFLHCVKDGQITLGGMKRAEREKPLEALSATKLSKC